MAVSLHRYAEPIALFKLSIFSRDYKQAKTVDFGEIICDTFVFNL